MRLIFLILMTLFLFTSCGDTSGHHASLSLGGASNGGNTPIPDPGPAPTAAVEYSFGEFGEIIGAFMISDKPYALESSWPSSVEYYLARFTKTGRDLGFGRDGRIKISGTGSLLGEDYYSIIAMGCNDKIYLLAEKPAGPQELYVLNPVSNVFSATKIADLRRTYGTEIVSCSPNYLSFQLMDHGSSIFDIGLVRTSDNKVTVVESNTRRILVGVFETSDSTPHFIHEEFVSGTYPIMLSSGNANFSTGVLSLTSIRELTNFTNLVNPISLSLRYSGNSYSLVGAKSDEMSKLRLGIFEKNTLANQFINDSFVASDFAVFTTGATSTDFQVSSLGTCLLADADKIAYGVNHYSIPDSDTYNELGVLDFNAAGAPSASRLSDYNGGQPFVINWAPYDGANGYTARYRSAVLCAGDGFYSLYMDNVGDTKVVFDSFSI